MGNTDEDTGSGKALRVLVVDDDRDCRELVALILTKEGLDVRLADDGRALLGAFSGEDRTFPDVVVSDLCMPDIGGASAFRILRRAGCRTPFVLISGMDEKDLAPLDREMTGMTLLRKPFEPETLVTAVLRAGLSVDPMK